MPIVTLYESTLSLLLGLATWHQDAGEPIWARQERLEPVAGAVAVAVMEALPIDSGRQQQWASALVVVAWSETRLARYVLEGRCLDGPVGARCDAGRARGPWQVWDWCHGAWEHPDGSYESYLGGARCALRYLRGAGVRCLSRGVDFWVGAFSGGRGGATCDAGYGRRRAALLPVYLQRLRR